MAEVPSRLPAWFVLLVLAAGLCALGLPFVVAGSFIVFCVLVATEQDASLAFWAGMLIPGMVCAIAWPVVLAGNTVIRAERKARS